MRVLTATSTTQGDRGGDICHTTDGELVTLPVLECACPDCGCVRHFAGLDSHRATTTCLVAEVDLDADGLRRAVARSLAAQGWIAPVAGLDPWLDDERPDERPGGCDGLDDGLDDGLALDREVVDDVLARMRVVAEAFAAGTVLGRVDGGVVVRRAPAT